MVNQIVLKAKSEELNIPFLNLLAGAMTEMVLFALCDGEEIDKLLLTNRNEIGILAYKKNVCDRLNFVYTGSEIPYKDISDRITDVLKETGISASCEKEDFGLKVVLLSDGLRAVVNVFIEVNHIRDVIPQRDTLQILTENNKTISYFVYPTEQILSSQLMEIMEKLELINDMTPYYRVAKILSTKSINGRKVKECLLNLIESSGAKVSLKTVDLLSYYGGYSYMQKKWKSYSKRNDVSEYEWKDIIESLVLFIRPILRSIETKEIFLGDWMPGLKRFLD